MVELQRLRSDHAAAILAFEVANRAYFSVSVTDRGDEFFEEFPERHRALLAEQDAGVSVFHLLLDEDATVVGRFNLYDLRDGTAKVGYRVAEEVAGCGVATSALRELCRLATEQYGLRTLTAQTSNENIASRRVLEKAGFVPVGPTDVGGRRGTLYECALDPSNDRGSADHDRSHADDARPAASVGRRLNAAGDVVRSHTCPAQQAPWRGWP
jgi:ribosomal-protein-alanine N-acetyltransferase